MKQPKSQNLTIWMTLLSQGGFDLGLGAEVAKNFPGWGDKFKSVIVACVIIHQVIFLSVWPLTLASHDRD